MITGVSTADAGADDGVAAVEGVEEDVDVILTACNEQRVARGRHCAVKDDMDSGERAQNGEEAEDGSCAVSENDGDEDTNVNMLMMR